MQKRLNQNPLNVKHFREVFVKFFLRRLVNISPLSSASFYCFFCVATPFDFKKGKKVKIKSFKNTQLKFITLAVYESS